MVSVHNQPPVEYSFANTDQTYSVSHEQHCLRQFCHLNAAAATVELSTSALLLIRSLYSAIMPLAKYQFKNTFPMAGQIIDFALNNPLASSVLTFMASSVHLYARSFLCAPHDLHTARELFHWLAPDIAQKADIAVVVDQMVFKLVALSKSPQVEENQSSNTYLPDYSQLTFPNWLNLLEQRLQHNIALNLELKSETCDPDKIRRIIYREISLILKMQGKPNESLYSFVVDQSKLPTLVSLKSRSEEF